MADLHGQPLVTTLTNTQRIAAGETGQVGAVNILPENLRLQFTAPTVGETFAGGNINLGNLRGTYYTAFTQTGNITFNFVSAVNGGNAFIQITSNGTGTFNFTAVESFNISTGDTLPAGDYIFRFLQTPYGVSVAVFRTAAGGGITNTAANNEIPKSDGTNLIPSGINATLSAGEVNLTGARALFNIFSNLGGAVTITTQASAASTGLLTLSTGSVTGAGNTSGNIAMSTGIAASEDSGAITLTTGNAFNNSGDISILTGAVNDAGQASGSIILTPGPAGGSATKGNVTIDGINWPTADGGANQSLVTDGAGNLSFAMVSGIVITASNGLSLVGDDIRLGGSVTNTTTIVASQSLSIRGNTVSGSVGFRAIGNGSLELVVDIGGATFIGFTATENGQSSTFQFVDSKTTPTGLVYAADYSAGFTDRSLVDKAYVDPGTPAQRITALTSTANATSIDFESGSRFREFSLSLNEDTTISFANAASRSAFRIYLTITGATRTITLPSTSLMPSDTSNITGVTYTPASDTLALDVGLYELKNDFDGTNDLFAITSAYI